MLFHFVYFPLHLPLSAAALLLLSVWCAVIGSLKCKGKMASLWRGKSNDFGNATLSAPHTLTHIYCVDLAKAFLTTSSPAVGMTICSHAATLMGMFVHVHLHMHLFTCVHTMPPSNVLFPSVCTRPFKQGERLLAGFNGKCGLTSETFIHPVL